MKTAGRWKRGFAFPLLLVLVGAGLFRFGGLRWDAACEPPDSNGEVRCTETHLHPDERFLTMVADRIEPPAPSAYFDTAHSSWNPRNRDFGFFVYGTWPIHLVDWISHRIGRDGYGDVHLVGRFVSACWSLGTVLLLFVLGHRVGGSRLGLLAALLLATSVTSIQHAHFFTSEAPLAFGATLAVLAAMRLQARVDGRGALLFGAAFGLAMAVKVSVISMALLALVAVWIGRPAERAPVRFAAWSSSHPAARRWLLLAVAGGTSLFIFRILQPYAFQGPGVLGFRLDPQWLDNMNESRRLAGGWVDFPPNHQWTDRTRWLYPWQNLIGVGLGPALGLTVTLAWAWSGWRVLVKRRLELAMPWLAVSLIFLHQGGQWVKSLRYLMPVVPCMCLLAAWALLRAIDRARPRGWRRVAQGATILVVLGSLLWALAFTSIYRRPHPRIEASRWIHQHVEPGATISNESWDDALPVPIDGRIGMSEYRGELIDPYADDSPEKLETLLSTLAEADYLVISSNRGYDSVARLPARYPMTIRYYQSLFDGQLGFRRVGDWTSYPQLFGIRFPDQGFEESFSVYDHPRVQIFERTAAFDVEAARALLEVDWSEVRHETPRQTAATTNLLLDDSTRTRMEAAGLPTSARIETARPGAVGATIRWMLLLEALTLGGFLIAFPLFGRLSDRGLLAMRAGSLLVFGWAVWFGASLGWTPFSPGALRAAFVVWLVAAVVCGWHHRGALRAWWTSARGIALSNLAVFWTAFSFMLAIRMANPDLWHPNLGGEKPMDLAYLGAVMRSVEFPPFDPWFAGGTMNYYYFGWVLVGALGLLAGLPVDLVYNLAIPTFLALFVAGAHACGQRLWSLSAARRPRRWTGSGGALALVLLAVCGNWAIWPLLWQRARAISFPEHHLFWNPSRAIPFVEGETTPITEFPFFTFLFADLHAHLMALPFGLLVVLLGLGWASSTGRRPPAVPSLRSEVGLLCLLALATGAAWPTNTWDAPTWLALAGLGLFVGLAHQRTFHQGAGKAGSPGGSSPLFDGRLALQLGIRLLVVLGLGRLLFAPFHQSFTSAYGSIALWQGSRTPFSAFLVHFGVVLVPLLVWLVQRHRPLAAFVDVGRVLRDVRAGDTRRHLASRSGRVVAVLLAAGCLALFLRPLDAMLLLLAAAAASDLLRRDVSPAQRWIAGLLGLGAALALSVEYIVLVGDIGRMNTVFKFYLQIWWIWGLATTCAAASWFGGTSPTPHRPRVSSPQRRLGVATLVGCLLLSLAYPVFGTWARVRDRIAPEAPRGLDGRGFLEHATFHEAGAPLDVAADLDAIRWLMENEPGSRTVLEGSIPEYRWGSRISRFTGLPTVIGWNWHQRQQRAAMPGEPVYRRLDDLHTLYSGTDPSAKRDLLERHRVRWVVVGDLERATYDAEGLALLVALPELSLAYRSGSTAVYAVDIETSRTTTR